MAWLLLILAGILEVVWAGLLPATEGFTRLIPSVGFLAALAGSMLLLSIAVQTIPIGTAYAVWVGIGAVGAAVAGAMLYGEQVTPIQMAALGLLVLAILAVKLTATS